MSAVLSLVPPVLTEAEAPWVTAARLEALADWLDDELAGGAPAKDLVHTAINAARYVAERAR